MPKSRSEYFTELGFEPRHSCPSLWSLPPRRAPLTPKKAGEFRKGAAYFLLADQDEGEPCTKS